MFQENDVPLKYTGTVTTVTTYDTGLKDYANIDEIYAMASLREKVVCKMDITFELSRYFKEETIRELRPVLMVIAKGLLTDPVEFSKCITTLINYDERFKKAIRDIYNSCPEDVSFGNHIINVISDTILSTETNYRSFFRGKPEVVICISDGYLYFSVVDVDTVPMLPNKYDLEVLSRAKNWRGVFQYV